METMAQEWIDEGFAKGIEKGKREGLAEGIEKGIEKGKREGLAEGIEKGKLVAQRQTLLRLIQWRFAPTDADFARYATQLDQINNLEQLSQLVDHMLAVPTQAEFAQTLQRYLSETEAPQ